MLMLVILQPLMIHYRINASKQPKPSQTEAYHIGSIRLEGISGEEEKWIRKKIALRENSEVSPEEEIDGTLAMLQD